MKARKEGRITQMKWFDIDVYGTAYGGIMWAFVLKFTIYDFAYWRKEEK